MTQALLEWETIDAEQIADIMAGKPPRPPRPIRFRDADGAFPSRQIWAGPALNDGLIEVSTESREFAPGFFAHMNVLCCRAPSPVPDRP